MNIAAIITARMNSTRLENKVLIDLSGNPVVGHVIRRASKFPEISNEFIVLAIPDSTDCDPLETIAENYGVKCFRGSEDDVLGRILGASEMVSADIIYRITADNPLIDPGVAEATWNEFNKSSCDYCVMENSPLGTTSEIVAFNALLRANELANNSRLREHPTLALYENNTLFNMRLFDSPAKWNRPGWRFTVDTPEDLSFVNKIFTELGPDCTLDSIVPFLDAHPEILEINSNVSQDGWDGLKRRKDEITITGI